jgi:hypothetical protein
MKSKILFLSACVLTLVSSAFAVDVVLNSDSIELPAGDVRLIRTAETPKKVKLRVPVEMGKRFCAVMGTRVIDGWSGAHCGWDQELRFGCYRDVVYLPGPGGRLYRTVVKRCYDRLVNTPRYCSWEIPECDRYDTEYAIENRRLKLKFKNVEHLEGSQTETYELRARQNHVDGKEAVYDLRAIDVKRPVKIVERDGLFTFFKDVAVVRGK